jgi:hypothetical protein
MLVHSGEELPLLQNLGACATGCRLDVGQLLDAGSRVARALEDGADIVIINRFGRQEREGKGLSYLIERALSADIPVVIAVPLHRFTDWIRFAGGMSVKLRCDRDALDAWWNGVSVRVEVQSHNVTAAFAKSSNKAPEANSYSVSCLCPHSLQANLTRVPPLSVKMRLGAPHLPQTASIRVLPCFTTSGLRAMASRINRSASSRIVCFDIRACRHHFGCGAYSTRRA